ncbi:MAG: S1C family serine protease [Dehalococcoidia bacterium]
MRPRFLGFALVVAALLGGCVLATPTSTPAPRSTPTPTPPPTTATPSSPVGQLPSLADIVERVEPAVVQVVAEVLVGRDFFGNPIFRPATGSGVIFDPRGYILTNNHVVEGSRSISVTLADGRTLDATLVGRDDLTDLAVLELSDGELPTAPLGDSTILRVGDWVIAIGHALALGGEPTVTLGVVSAKGRSIPVDGGITLNNLIQTDATINPGNSGGPLLNLAGEVIGINTAKISGGNFEGIGFAVATEIAIPVSQQILAHGRVPWPWFGIILEDVTVDLAMEMGLEVNRGILIRQVVQGSPAWRAGLQVGDVMLALDGQEVARFSDLQRLLLREYQPGDEAVVTVNRAGREQDFTIVFAERPTG